MKFSGNFTSAIVTFMVKTSDTNANYSKIEVGKIDTIIMQYDKGEWAIAKQEITDDHRMAALGILSYMNMIKRKMEQESLADLWL